MRRLLLLSVPVVGLAAALAIGLVWWPVSAPAEDKQQVAAPRKPAAAKADASVAPAPASAPAAAAAPATLQPAIQSAGDARTILTLVRSTLIALHQGNVTGNYSVFRDMAVPSFQAANSAADLARIFTTLRNAGIDLAGVAVLDPRLTETPTIDAAKTLRVAGIFGTSPQPVRFEMLFQPYKGTWRVFGLAVLPQPAAVASAAPAASPAPASTPQPSVEPVTIQQPIAPPIRPTKN